VAAGVGDVGAGTEDRHHAGGAQLVVVLRWDHAAADDEDVLAARLLQLVDELRDEGLVAGGLARHPDDVDVVLDRGAGDLLRGLEQRPEVDVEPDAANAVPTTLAPRSWPSWPILAISSRGRRPSSAAKSATSATISEKSASPRTRTRTRR
jgi:hypothetical protein